MRPTTIASIVVLAVSTAALAQVATAPVEQKIPADNSASFDSTTDANAASAETLPGGPSTALVNSAATPANKPPK